MRRALSAPIALLAMVVAAGCPSESDGEGEDAGAACATCADVNQLRANANTVCAGVAEEKLAATIACFCEGTCRDVCLDSVCQGVPSSEECRTCFQQDCAAEIEDCNAN